jgi:hypothetical protein
LLGQFEAQEASNARLWSGALRSWRTPADVLDIGTNSLRWSNDFSNAAWTQTGLASVTANATAGPDASTTADKINESTASSLHTVKQTVTKISAIQKWTGAVSVSSAERTFAYVAVGDGTGSNGVQVIVNLATGAITLQQVLGTYSALTVSVVAEANGFKRIHLKCTTNTSSAVQLVVGPALNGTTYVYVGSTNSGIYAYGASLRQSARAGAYRETFGTALPTIATIYLYKNTYWFVSATRASFIKGPIAGDTTDAVYFTGGPADRPSVTYDPIAYAGGTGRGDMPRQWYTCGLPAPLTAPVPTVQNQTGSVTNVTNVLDTKADQTVATFTSAVFSSDGYDVVPHCRFRTTVQTSTVTSFVVLMQISRSGIIVAEAEKRVNLTYTSGVTVTELVDVTVFARDAAPASASNQYTFTVTLTAASGTFSSTVYSHTEISVRYAKVKLTIGSAHPFKVNDKISVSGVLGFESVNQLRMPVIATESNAVWVDLVAFQTYTSGGTWIRDYDEDEKQDTGWVVTFLTQVGNHVQEGPPSPISALLAIGSGQPVSLVSIPTTPPSDGGIYNITGKRLYRTNVASNGDANFQFVTDLLVGDTSYIDSKRFVELGEIMPSDTDDTGDNTRWSAPPTDLRELTAMHNGVLAGISKNQICFSVPFQPHAWPAAYRLSVNFSPVGLAAFGESLLVTTAGKPQLIIGIEPSSFRTIPTELAQPCLSIAGIVDMGDYVVYPGDDGLIMVSSAKMGSVTQQLFTKEEWQALNPSTFIAGEYDGRYVCFYTHKDGIQSGFILDPREPEASFTTLDIYASVAWTDQATGDLYLVIDEKIMKWDSHVRDRMTKRWRSKRFNVIDPVCPAYARVIAKAYPIDFSLYANVDPDAPESMESVKSKTVESGQPFVLPDGYSATCFELEVQGGPDVTEVSIGSSIAELKRVR